MAFDTERAARRLADAGLDERAANGVADVVASATDGLATEASLESGLHALETSLLEVKSSIAALEGRIDASIAKLEARFARALWLQGMGILAGTAAIVTIINVLD